jgi:hypothetical protein
MKHVFGPVPSKRLGQLLGIDPFPFNTCNWNCVYCQLGRTAPLTGVRLDYFPPEEITTEAKASIDAHRRAMLPMSSCLRKAFLIFPAMQTLPTPLAESLLAIPCSSRNLCALLVDGRPPRFGRPWTSWKRAARVVVRYGRRFWAPVAARYGETQSRSAASHRRGCR